MKSQAVDLAKRGFRVFPIAAGKKFPKFDDWQAKASSDCFFVFDNWTDETWNIGVATGEYTVIDADAAKGGLESLAALGELPATFTVRTARGGLHLYFRTPPGKSFGNSVQRLAPGVDVRAAGGLVVGPGSTFEGGRYEIERDLPVADLPAGLEAMLSAAPEVRATAGETRGILDAPEALAAALAYLERAPEAVEGAGGDATTFQVACAVLDFGVSPDTAIEMMVDNWNDRCSPPWDWDDLAKKITNAANYRQDPIGRNNPVSGAFGAIVPPPHVERENSFMANLRPFTLTQATAAEIPKRPWLATHRLMRGKITNLIAPGSAGKSLLSLQWAISLALGDGKFCGLEARERCNVIVINNEDEPEELDRRMSAIFEHFDLPWTEAHNRIFMFSGIVQKFKAIRRQNKGVRLETTQEFADLAAAICELKIGAVILDPLVSVHEADENNNSEMQVVMEAFTSLAAVTSCAVMLVHHTNKPPSASSESAAGSMNVGRGASAIRDAARIQLTLFAMSKADGENYNIPEHSRHRYVRLDDAKANLHLAGGACEWFEKRTVRIGNGEDLGVLQPVRLERADAQVAETLAEILAASPEGEMSVTAAVSLIASDILFASVSEHKIRGALFEAFRGGVVKIGGREMRLERKGATGGTVYVAELNSSA